MRVGQFIGDRRFELLDKLGSGGMATVWRARDHRLKVLRAIKILSPAMAQHSRAAKRFLAEAQAMAGIEHPNVARVYDFNVDQESGSTYLVMELITGQDLKNHIHQQGPQTPQVAAEMMIQILRGLAHVHQEGIVHRDIKPGNILIGADHVPKLVDFGIARIADSTMDATKTGAIMGTFNYMAPEQHISTKTAGPQADIYSCGGTFYYMLTGCDPVNLAVDSYQSELFEPLPKPIVPILHEACSARSETRFQTAHDFIAALEAIQPELIGLSAQTRPTSEPPFAGLDPEEDDGRPESDTWGGFDGVQNPPNGDDDVTRDFTGPSQSQHPSEPVSMPDPVTAHVDVPKPSNKMPLVLLGVGLASIALALWLEKSPKPSTNQPEARNPATQTESTAIREIETPTMEPDPAPPTESRPEERVSAPAEPPATPELSTTDGEVDDSPGTATGASDSSNTNQEAKSAIPTERPPSPSPPVKPPLLSEDEIDCKLSTLIQTYNELVGNEQILRSQACDQKNALLRTQIDLRRQVASLQRKIPPDQPQEVHLTARVIFGMALIQTSHLSSHLTTTCPDQTFAGLAELAVQAQTGQSLLESALVGSEQLGFNSRWIRAGAKLR